MIRTAGSDEPRIATPRKSLARRRASSRTDYGKLAKEALSMNSAILAVTV